MQQYEIKSQGPIGSTHSEKRTIIKTFENENEVLREGDAVQLCLICSYRACN